MIDSRGNVIVTLQNLRPSSDSLKGSMRTVVVSSRNSRAKLSIYERIFKFLKQRLALSVLSLTMRLAEDGCARLRTVS